MDPQHHPLSPHIQQRHHDGIKDLELPGLNGNGEIVPWVPYSSLREYWGPVRLEEVLCHLIPAPPISIVRDRYLRVFTILVLLNKVEYISQFTSHGLTDDYWPQSQAYWRWTPTFEPFFDAFLSKQWTFFPLDFHRHNLIDRHIPCDRILPFQSIEQLPANANKGEEVTVSKALIYEPTGQKDDAGSHKIGTYFLKTYDLSDDELDRAYDRENNAYVLMESMGPSNHVVTFYGSYRQNRKGNLILEYVDGGTLWDYLRKTDKPQTAEDIHAFWRSASGLADGLRVVHQVTEVPSSLPRRGVIHQDLKPDNILVDVKVGSQSLYEFDVKWTDFGHSSVATAEGEKLKGVDHHGNATYSPPEAAHHFEAIERGQDSVTSALDVWALGCIYVQLAAWVADGFENIKTLGDLRKEELSHHPRFVGSNSGNSFHNGADTLRSIKEYYNLIMSQISGWDEITPRILDIVMEDMLRKEPNSRLGSKQLYLEIDSMLCKLNPDASYEGTRRPPTRLAKRTRLAHSRSDATPPSLRDKTLTIDQCVEDRLACKLNRPRNDKVRSMIDNLRKSLGFRDHLFLIDDSPSMKQHHKDIVQAFTALSYVAKRLDRDGLELAFISSPQIVTRNKKTTRLIELVQGHSYDSDSELMEDKLGKFLQEAVVSKFPHLTRYISFFRNTPLTVIVFTDGSWGANQEHAAGVQNPVIDLMQTMRSRGVARTDVTIQFLRFGDDHYGKGYLSYLDKMGQKDNQDIVDTRTIEDNVVDILMSSISTVRDQNNNATERSRSSTL